MNIPLIIVGYLAPLLPGVNRFQEKAAEVITVQRRIQAGISCRGFRT